LALDGTAGSLPVNLTFPLIITSLQRTATGLSPTPADPAATLTVFSSSSVSANSELKIPSLGVDQQICEGGRQCASFNSLNGLSYAVMGSWTQGPSANSPNAFSDSQFVFGYETPQAAMPTSRTAMFMGQNSVSANVYKAVGTEIQTGGVGGNASISVDFGSGAINGSFTNMMVTPTEHWNDVSVTANIATGSNRFNGTTAAASAPGTPMSLLGSAVGKINGAFYGPAAQNLGAVWSLSDGTGSALGIVVAGH
jgi:hypothetical protein